MVEFCTKINYNSNAQTDAKNENMSTWSCNDCEMETANRVTWEKYSNHRPYSVNFEILCIKLDWGSLQDQNNGKGGTNKDAILQKSFTLRSYWRVLRHGITVQTFGLETKSCLMTFHKDQLLSISLKNFIGCWVPMHIVTKVNTFSCRNTAVFESMATDVPSVGPSAV